MSMESSSITRISGKGTGNRGSLPEASVFICRNTAAAFSAKKSGILRLKIDQSLRKSDIVQKR